MANLMSIQCQSCTNLEPIPTALAAIRCQSHFNPLSMQPILCQSDAKRVAIHHRSDANRVPIQCRWLANPVTILCQSLPNPVPIWCQSVSNSHFNPVPIHHQSIHIFVLSFNSGNLQKLMIIRHAHKIGAELNPPDIIIIIMPFLSFSVLIWSWVGDLAVFCIIAILIFSV